MVGAIQGSEARVREEMVGAIQGSEARVREEMVGAIQGSEARLREEMVGAIQGSEARLREHVAEVVHASQEETRRYTAVLNEGLRADFRIATEAIRPLNRRVDTLEEHGERTKQRVDGLESRLTVLERARKPRRPRPR